ncbi:MAG: TetR/AcrR family transcriptional regulator [Polyangia bacterium]
MNSDSAETPVPIRLRERLRQAAAQQILGAAEQVFAERGVHATHMADIAARAGVAVGTLYNHFEDRDALLRALAEQRRVEILQQADECLAQIDGKPFRAQLRAFYTVLFAHFEQHWQFFMMFMSAESGSKVAQEHARAMQCELLQRYEILVERGRKQRAVRPKVAPLLPTLLLGMNRSLLMRRVLVPAEGPAAQHIDALLDFILNGVSGKKAP